MQTIRDQVAGLLRQALDANPLLSLGGQSIDSYVDKLLAHAALLTWHEEGKLIGLVAYYCNDPQSGVAFISMVAVAESYQRGKLATILMQAVLASIRTRSFRVCRLHVHRDSLAAISLYQKLGFKKVGLEGKEVVMELVL